MKRRVLQMQCGCAFVRVDGEIGLIERRWSCGIDLLAHPPFVQVGRVERVTNNITFVDGDKSRFVF